MLASFDSLLDIFLGQRASTSSSHMAVAADSSRHAPLACHQSSSESESHMITIVVVDTLTVDVCWPVQTVKMDTACKSGYCIQPKKCRRKL
jgi:hypothetical protein